MRCSLQRTESVIVLCLAALLGTAPLCAVAIEPTIYERELLAERRAIVQLHLEMDTDLWEGNGVSLTRSKRIMWQDGGKRRCDETREYLDAKGVTEVQPYRLVAIETPEYFFFWDGKPQPPPTKLCAYFGSISETNYKGYRYSLPFDVRLLGLNFSFILDNNLPWDFLIGSPERAAPAVVETSGDQVKVSFTIIRKGAAPTQEQIYEKRGERHLLRSVTVIESGTKQRTSMECTYPDTFISGFAFPDSVECKMVRDDNYIVVHDKTKIRLKSVNEAIPRSRFSLVTAEMPPGTPVIGKAIPPELLKPFHHIQWNGEALVPVPNSEIILRDDDHRGRK